VGLQQKNYVNSLISEVAKKTIMLLKLIEILNLQEA